RLVASRRPVTFHHLIGHPPEEIHVRLLGDPFHVGEDLRVGDVYPVELAVGSADHPVQRDVHDQHYFSHVLLTQSAGIPTSKKLSDTIPRVRYRQSTRSASRAVLIPDLASSVPETQPTAKTSPGVREMPEDANKEIVRRWTEDGYGKGRVDLIEELFDAQ